MELPRWPKPKPVDRMVRVQAVFPYWARYYGWFRIAVFCFIGLIPATFMLIGGIIIIRHWGELPHRPARLIVGFFIGSLFALPPFFQAVVLYRGRHPRPDGNVPAGWYPDPVGVGRFRYFDGTFWKVALEGGHSPRGGAGAAQPPVAPAGWYADPGGSGRRRYFDGREWTNQYS